MEPISLVFGFKEIFTAFGVLIISNIASLKYIVNGKFKQVDQLDKRVSNVERQKWNELNLLADQVNKKLDHITKRIDSLHDRK